MGKILGLQSLRLVLGQGLTGVGFSSLSCCVSSLGNKDFILLLGSLKVLRICTFTCFHFKSVTFVFGNLL